MSVKITEDGQISIPWELLNIYGLQPNDDVEISATATGLLISKLTAENDPVEQVYGIWGKGENTDDYMKTIRDR